MNSTPAATRLTDWLGIAASIACAIHCAAMPFVVMLLPALGLSFLADESFHRVMVVVCSLLAGAAFLPGFKRHRRWMPIGVAAIGLSLIATAAFGFEDTCCPSCVAEVRDATAGHPAETETLPVCTLECCESSSARVTPETEAAPETDKTTGTEATVAASLIGRATPWLTPIGGLLLVAAHLTNRQLSCHRDCCPAGSGDGKS